MSLGAAGTSAPPGVQTGNGGIPSQNVNAFAAYNAGGTTGLNASTPQTGSQIAPPAAAFSPYEYQDVSGAHITLGPQIASLLGLNPSQQYSGAAIMQAFLDAPATAVQAVEQDLYAAGMYVNAAGEQPQTGIVTGQMDNNAFEAMSQAILMVNNASGETLSSYLAQQQLSGAGQARINKALQPITGGGNAYQVQLPSPTDIYATAMQIFQQYLGRNPTQAELDGIVQQVQSQSAEFQQAQIGQTESQQQAKYQQAVSSRNAVMTPASATNSQVPNGPFSSPGQWAVALLQYMGDPVTTSSVALMVSWIQQNGGLNGPGKNNPLGVQATAGGSTPSKGAENYTSPAEGIQAAAQLLNAPQYSALRTALSGQPVTADGQKLVNSEVSQWTGGKVTSLKPGPATAAAQAAVSEYGQVSQQNPQNPATPGMSGNNREIGGLPSAPGDAAIRDTMEQGANNPQVGAYLQAQYNAGQASPNGVPSGSVGSPQGMASPGDSYAPASILTQTQAPSASAVATEAATTGANKVPYMGQQWLDAYGAIVNLIQSPLKG